MTQDNVPQLDILNGRLQIDPHSGAITSLRLSEPDTEFIARHTGAGLLRFALPLSGHSGHHVELGTHGQPEISHAEGGLRLRYSSLATADGPVAVSVEIDLSAAEDGLRLRARVHNATDQVIPQVIFPQLPGLAAIDGPNEARVQFGRGALRPLREITMRPDDAHYLETRLQRYVPYGRGMHTMKWFDYGSSWRGLTLYAHDTRDTTQGLLVDRPDRADDRINLHWIHFPSIQPGETWDSGEYVLLLHSGDWYAGARAYQRYAAEHYPYHAPQRLREALGVRSMWAAVRSAKPAIPLSDIPEYAAELADPDLDLAELVVWHWWLKNGYPIFLDPRLGTEEEFKAALDRCRELGVPVSLFVSHHLLRDSDETDPSWTYLNAAGQRVLSNWTYGPGFAPKFGPPFMGTHSMVRGSARSSGWRATGLEQYQQIQDKYGPVSLCFDVFSAPPEPDFNPAGDGRPDEEGEYLLEFGRQARALIQRANEGTNPQATFSGEHVTDTRVPVLDYTWEWKNGFNMEEAAPFRYVFPQFRLNANVNEHPRGALLAFMEGALLNVIPGNMHSFRLRDCPELVATLRKLAALRRRFLRYFTEGQYRYVEGLTVTGCTARLYTHGKDVLVIACNPTDQPVDASVEIDTAAWGASPAPGTLRVLDLNVVTVIEQPCAAGVLRQHLNMQADTLHAFEITQRNT